MSPNPRGKAGEDFAAHTLIQMGYRILGRNVYSRYGELDIVASKGEVIAFVEVKSRRRGSLVLAEESVGRTKQKKIIATALLYLQDHPECSLQPRFDLFCVITDGKGGVVSYDYLMGAFDGEAYEGATSDF